MFEVERPRRRERRNGKSDRLDALLAAKKVLAGDGLSTPRGHGKRLALQMLLVAYHSVVSERSRLYNQLQALQVSAPAALRERIGPREERREARTSDSPGCAPAQPPACKRTPPCKCSATSPTALARSIAKPRTTPVRSTTLARELAPALLEEPGVGPICAGKLIAFNPARFTSEAAFARANGTAPQPASSGKTIRHRLSRGGDRQINTAIYTIALSRSVHHPPSRAYMQRRIDEGKTKREAMRSLKRHLSRHLYNQLINTPLTT